MLNQRKSGQAITIDWILSNGIPSGDCLNWSGKIRKDGYGSIKINRKQRRITRVLARLLYGDSELHVLHSCDNPLCIKPDHISYGTQAVNLLECRDRNRRPSMQKLTKEQAYKIKYEEQGLEREIALRYGVSRSTINNIKTGYRWSDI